MEGSSAGDYLASHDPLADFPVDYFDLEPEINPSGHDFGFSLDETVFDGTCEVEDCQELPPFNQNVGFVDDRILLQDFGNADLHWKQAAWDLTSGKCHCSACSKKAFENDLNATFGLEIPNHNHVLAFQLPESTMEPLESNDFSYDLSLLQSEREQFQNVSKKRGTQASRDTSRNKRRKKKTNISKSTGEVAMSLIQDAVRSEGAISESLFAKMKQLTQAANSSQRSQSPNPTSSEQLRTQVSVPTRTLSVARPVARAEPCRIDPAPPTASSSRYGASTATLRRPQAATRQSQTQFQCTFKLCLWSHNSRREWQRHEESVHKQRYMCKECSWHAHPLGGYSCGVCMDSDLPPFPSLEAVKTHILQCRIAREAGTSYPRKDKLRTHLRREHGMRVIQEDAFDWVYDVDREWWRECGFCGVHFDDWELRASHIEAHFRQGADIATWIVPFRKARKTSSEGTDSSGGDDSEEDDDDDNEDDSDNDEEILEDHENLDENQTPGRSHDAEGHRADNIDPFRTNGNFNYYAITQTTLTRRYTHFDGNGMHLGLQRFIESDEQHERLLLGLGRRPLSVSIGVSMRENRTSSLPERTGLQTPHIDQLESRSVPDIKRPQTAPIGHFPPGGLPKRGGRKVETKGRAERRRVPDNGHNYMTTITSSNGNMVHAHEARRFDPQEPRASDARSGYGTQQRREDREYYARR